jgi:hypothetical protein
VGCWTLQISAPPFARPPTLSDAPAIRQKRFHSPARRAITARNPCSIQSPTELVKVGGPLFLYLSSRRPFVDCLLGRTAELWLRDKRFDLCSEYESLTRHAERCQATPSDQVGNGLLRYTSNSRRFGLRNPVFRFHRFPVFSG